MGPQWQGLNSSTETLARGRGAAILPIAVHSQHMCSGGQLINKQSTVDSLQSPGEIYVLLSYTNILGFLCGENVRMRRSIRKSTDEEMREDGGY